MAGAVVLLQAGVVVLPLAKAVALRRTAEAVTRLAVVATMGLPVAQAVALQAAREAVLLVAQGWGCYAIGAFSALPLPAVPPQGCCP